MKIDITAVNLKNQKPKDVKCYWVSLEPNYVRFRLSMWAEEPINSDDLELGWESVFNDIDIVALKKNISGLEKCWVDVSKKWGVYILVKGFGGDIKMFFKKETEAQTIFDLLLEYINQ